jgi:hypothetical protein
VRRYLDVRDDATVDDIAFVAANLQALGGPNHGSALAALRALSSVG